MRLCVGRLYLPCLLLSGCASSTGASWGFDACRNAVQGKIAWNIQGDTHWAQRNIDRLCAGGAGVEPARCFDRLMGGTVSWGGGTRWEWENALNLCHGSRDAGATVGCFEAQIQTGVDWPAAIASCNSAAPPQPQSPASRPAESIAACHDAVQGRIPWNAGGDTRWAEANIARLCRGGAGDEPARCFERLMHGEIDWGGGTTWAWENALRLCQASQAANATLACFQGQMRANIPWQDAIPNCTADSAADPVLPEPALDLPPAKPGEMRTMIVAGGCFWCIEAVFEVLSGITDATSGYAGGTAETATYKQCSSGRTGHAESVRVTYDPSKISFAQLLQIFFTAHDPTTKDRQGPDSGHQYRGAFFYADEDQRRVVEAYIRQLESAKTFSSPIVTTLEPLTGFYPAEEYHQDFVRLHPDHPYVRGESVPKVRKICERFPELVKR